jgi:hypothetical protein
MSKNKKKRRKYQKPVSLYPLKPEEALSAFMKIKSKQIRKSKDK